MLMVAFRIKSNLLSTTSDKHRGFCPSSFRLFWFIRWQSHAKYVAAGTMNGPNQTEQQQKQQQRKNDTKSCSVVQSLLSPFQFKFINYSQRCDIWLSSSSAHQNVTETILYAEVEKNVTSHH